jgi:hypothetical protein
VCIEQCHAGHVLEPLSTDAPAMRCGCAGAQSPYPECSSLGTGELKSVFFSLTVVVVVVVVVV